MDPNIVQWILSLDFPPEDRVRYEALSAKASEGTMTADERAEFEVYRDVNDLLAVMKARARRFLREGLQ